MTGATGHRFSNLIGAADGVAIDAGHLNVTWHHNWWADNVAERMPRSRDGQIHVVNNLFTAIGNDYCSNSGNLSKLLVENNKSVRADGQCRWSRPALTAPWAAPMQTQPERALQQAPGRAR